MNINRCRGYKYITGKVYFTHLSIFMAVLKQCTTSTAETNKWRMTNEPARPTPTTVQRTTIALTSHTNTQLIKRQKTRGANNEMNGEMRKNCLKGGVGLRYHWTILNLLFAFSSLSLVINDFRFDVSSPQPHNKNPLCFIQTAKKREKKKDFLLKKGGRGACCAAPIKQKGGR